MKAQRYGRVDHRRVHLRFRRESLPVNCKRVSRLYQEVGLAVRRWRRKRVGVMERKPLPKMKAANLSRSTDFVSDGLADGRRLRCLNIVDDCTRECVLPWQCDARGIRLKERRQESSSLVNRRL